MSVPVLLTLSDVLLQSGLRADILQPKLRPLLFKR